MPILPLPFIYPSLYHPPTSTVSSLRSVILSVPSVLLPLSGSARLWPDPDKRMLPVMKKEQRSWLSRGWRGVDGWMGVRVGKVLSKLWLSIVVSGLAPDPTPTSPISSVSNFLLWPPFPWASVFFQSEGWECRKRKMRQMSGTKLFARSAAWLLQARWRSTLSASPRMGLLVNTPGEVRVPPVRVQTLAQFSVVARSLLTIC